jgi:histidine triad (HIT) family protein
VSPYTGCVFCDYTPTPPAEVRYEWPDALVIKPLNPVTDGHVLIVPKAHVANAADDPTITAATFARAAEWTRLRPDEAFNLITSVGPLATQTVMHLHVHYVPRREGDGLSLPWSDHVRQPEPT